MTPVESGFLTSYANLLPTDQFPDLKLWREASEWIAGQQDGARHADLLSS